MQTQFELQNVSAECQYPLGLSSLRKESLLKIIGLNIGQSLSFHNNEISKNKKIDNNKKKRVFDLIFPHLATYEWSAVYTILKTVLQ